MYRMTGSLAAILAVLALVGAVVAGEPKAETPKADKSKAEQPKKESVEQRQQGRKEAFETAMADQDYDKAIAVLDEMLADKEVAEQGKTVAMMTKFLILAEKKGDGAKACPLAKKLSERKKDDEELLNALAWTILDTANLKDRDVDLALAIAKQACEASDYAIPAVLDTLALAYFEKGDFDKAIEWETKAVDKAKADKMVSDEQKASFKKTLDNYKAKQREKKEKAKKK